MNRKRSGPFIVAVTTLSFILIIAICGCSASPKQPAATSADMSKAVAKIIARNASAPMAFKDNDGANEVTASISETTRLKFALLLNKDLAPVGKYFVTPFDHENQHLLDSIQKRVRDGATEFTFEQDNLTISVVPVRQSNELQGYAAVGSL